MLGGELIRQPCPSSHGTDGSGLYFCPQILWCSTVETNRPFYYPSTTERIIRKASSTDSLIRKALIFSLTSTSL
jgi:hypothetical protein